MDKIVNKLLQGLFDIIFSVMQLVLESFLGRLLYYVEAGLCRIVGMLNQMFEVFAGITKVAYDGKKDYLINIFFSNNTISNVYWGMAVIGIVLAFGFAIAAVVRKMFDSSGKVQQSLGQTITALLQTIFLILGMSAIMIMVLGSTNTLMQQVNYIFNDAKNLDLPETIVYSEEQFSAMGRVLNTIGNYSLNPSYASKYNINTCYNEIRSDLYTLQSQNVFRYYYSNTDKEGRVVNTWQSVLQKIANAHDLRYDLRLDVSYDAVTKAMLEAMEVIRNDPSFRPLQSYKRTVPPRGSMPLDRYLFLMGTMRAAKNSAFNADPDIMDAVRGPYYTGEKNIYDIDDVSSDFDIGFATDYIIVFLTGFALIFDLVTINLNCIARIFNMLFLYIIAPPIFAVKPLDGGAKIKQWMTAFIVQAFSVFGTVIAMQLLLIILPIVTSAKLVLFEDGLMNIMAKLLFVYGTFEVAKKATGLLTGILADSAGWQSVQAGDMSSSTGKMFGGLASAASLAGRGAGKVLNFATKPAQNLAKQAYDETLGKWEKLGAKTEKQEAGEQAKKNIAVRDAEAEIMKGRGGGGKVQMGDGAGSSKLDKLGEGGGKSSGTSDTKTPQGNREAPASVGKRPTLDSFSGSGGNEKGGNKTTQAKQSKQSTANNQTKQPAQASKGNAPQKAPPELPGNQRGPLSQKAQQLFGMDANGKPQTRREQELSRLAANHPRPKVDELGNMKKPETRDQELSRLAANHPRPKVDELGNMKKPPAPPKQ
ncbi:MAG: hypothetical protein IJ649_07385 [Oscillospiraceae bacterium]|nr:hypothetical protein [Oscillospiraceae bacterium]